MSKLLILNSSSDQLTFLTYFLEKKQYVVKTLTHTLDLFSEIYHYKPDLLLLDTFFGGADGRELCKQLRSRPETKALGILIFSASEENLTDYRSYYADDFIQKPFNPDVLYGKIKSLLSWIPIRKRALNIEDAEPGMFS
ncbi:MAG: response regulator [Bacteroidia bacterium]